MSADRHVIETLDDVAVLPERVRLFHIGPPKTGTSNLQATAALNRERLLAAGVRYPGAGLTQRSAIASVLGRSVTFEGSSAEERGNPPQATHWQRLMSEIQADTQNRIWFGHEYAAGADSRQVQHFADDIGSRVHVLVTLRSFTRMLPSVWQQYNKAGNRGAFDPYARKVLSMDAEQRAAAPFHRRHDHAALVRRWADVVGPENMTVVILDPHDHAFAFHAVERLLGLERGFLADAESPSSGLNRGMSTAEIEFLRRINKKLRSENLRWADYEYLLAMGAFERLLTHRRPGATESMLTLLPRDAELAEANAARIVDELQHSGVRLVGDVANLLEPAKVRTDPAMNHTKVTSVPLDLAVEAVMGAVATATGCTAEFEPIERGHLMWPARSRSQLYRLPTKVLLRELARRVVFHLKSPGRLLKRDS
jgi:hypothetical protein